MFDLSIFASPDAWITLITLTFLEVVLGIDNIVFITITTDRLPESKRSLGRHLGLAGAFVMRAAFLSVAAWLTHLSAPLFTVDLGPYAHGFSVRDLILLAGGAYLVYKGIVEVRALLGLDELREHHETAGTGRTISMPQAIGVIMVMDLVFSIDSVITAVGLSDHLIVMVLAVMVAIILMMVFIDAISNFINQHVEMKILALTFIVAIGVLLVLDALGLHTDIEVFDMHIEKLMVYFAMAFAVVLEVIQMRYKANLARYQAELTASASGVGAGASCAPEAASGVGESRDDRS
ncbi:TerC family protein [Eggerthellaceae bacterium zg-1084]|uniref:TerC family protein n=1 Tax=Berryella wangjianweii TaxID=2734634 RepID=UPI001551E2AE|nr:TerC family protein [Berryella wangjianweii]NPD31397.1 TerC family protein [Berryella wangjianweii]